MRDAVAAAVLGLAVLTGCGGDSGGRAGDAEVVVGDLESRTFVSTEVRGHDLVAGTEVRLFFDAHHVSASAGCNTVFGDATVEDGALTLGEPGLATTLMACDADQEAQDEWLLALLESSPQLTLDGERLVVGDDTSGMTLTETD